jgi:uncharacterized protein (TIGR03435 family)
MARGTTNRRARYLMMAMIGGAHAVSAAGAQDATIQAPLFDTISITRASTSSQLDRRLLPRGWWVAPGADVRDLIRIAYASEGIRVRQQIVGVPDAIAEERFNVVVVPTAGVLLASRPDLHASMLRTALAERFGFEAHIETRLMQVWDLVRAGDHPGSKTSALECARQPPSLGGHCDASRGASSRKAEGITMSQLALTLSDLPELDGLVRDQTGLVGAFPVSLRWSGGSLVSTESRVVRFSRAGNELQLLGALRAQLGLHLEPREANVTVLVVDRVARPSGL